MEALTACPLFGGLEESYRRTLAGVMVLREAEKGDYLFFQGDRAEGFYVVVKGKVKVHRLAPDGREQVLHLFGPGEVVGEVPVFQGGNYPACAAAEGRVEALYLPGERFLELGEENPTILMEMLAVLSMRLRKFVGLIDDLSLKEVSARLAKHLLDLRSRAGEDRFRLDSSKTVLASKIGTISATMSRTFAKMQKRGILAVKGEEITVHDPDALLALASGEKL
jgi:CRP/FNR family transcriptional regulator